MFAFEDLRTADHEAAHAAVAWIMGLRVERCSIDGWSLKTGQAGLTATSLSFYDKRPLLERARARIMTTLAGPMTRPGPDCRDDVKRATAWCEGYGLSMTAMMEATDELKASELFRQVFGALQIALLEERELDEARVNEVADAAAAKLPDEYESVKSLRQPPTDEELRELITALEEGP